MSILFLALCLLAVTWVCHASDDDDDDGRSHFGRRLHAQENRIEAVIRAKLADFNKLQAGPAVARQAYQARFSRDVLGLNDTRTRGETRTIGPVLVVAKVGSNDIIADSFDGNVDGKDDVRAAYNAWAAASQVSSQEAELGAFLAQIRNRATVNGGSIDLRALVVSGRNAAGQFVKFDRNTILITPCFPVTTEAGYNLEFFAGGLDNAAGNTLLRSIIIPSTWLFQNGAFVDSLSSFAPAGVARFTMNRQGGFLPAIAANAMAMPPVVAVDRIPATGELNTEEARFTLQKCTQFSYFA
jgi:hypothetical protein